MAISVTCESCWLTFDVSEAHAGKRGKCPECGSPVEVPRASGPRSGGGGAALPPRTGTRRSASNRPASDRQRSRASRSESKKPLWILIGAGGGVAALLGVVALIVLSSGGSDADTRIPADDTPRMTAANGPPAVTPRMAAAPAAGPTGTPGGYGPAPGAPGTSGHAAAAPGPIGQYAGYPPSAGSTGQYGPPPGMARPADTASAYAGAARPGPVTAATDTSTIGRPGGEAAAQPPAVRRSLADLIEVIEPSVVRIDLRDEEGTGNGSGFVVDAEGIIATNYHVIAGVTNATAVFPDGGQAPIVGHVLLDPQRDIALLKIDYPAEKLRPLKLAASHPRKGESVVAFGAPLGLSFSASEGIISAIRTAQEIGEFGKKVEGTWIQTTTPISPGNSGGPLVNQLGEVVAMNTMVISVGQNLNFSISAVDLAEVLPKRVAQAVPLSPQTAPRLAEAPSREKVVDETATERGAKLLAEIKSVHLVVATFSHDPTGRIEQTVLAEARKAVERAGIEEAFAVERNPALCLVTMELGGTSGAAGARELTLSMVVMCRTTDDRGQVQVAQVWKERDSVGTFSIQSLYRGVIPNRAQSTISAFFRKFTSAVRKAERDLEKAEAESEAETEKADSGEAKED